MMVWGGVGFGLLVGSILWYAARGLARRYGVLPSFDAWGFLLILGLGGVGGISVYLWGWFWAVDVVVVTALLAGVALIDRWTLRIPNRWLALLAVWSGIQMLVWGVPDVRWALLGAITTGGTFALLAWWWRGALGWGDVKFLSVLGLLLGFPQVWWGVFLGMILGGVVIGVMLALRRVARHDVVAYGPYLALGGWWAFLHMIWDMGVKR